MSKKPTNFWDDYLNIRLKWSESSETKAKNRKKPDRLTKDGETIPKNIFRIGGQEKYRALAMCYVAGKKQLHHVGIFDSIEEAVEAQLMWKKLHATRRRRIDL